MPRQDLRLAAAFLAFVATSRPSIGDFLYPNGGGGFEARATVEGDRVHVRTPAGEATYRVADFRKIVPDSGPEGEWPARKKVADAGVPEVRLAAAWWALENGLTGEAVAEIRSAHKRSPEHAPTARLAEALDRLDRPCSDPDVSRLERALAVPCETATSPHILLLHQHSEADAHARLDLLERVYISFILWATGIGIDLEPPRQRLVCVYLKERGDYQAFLRGQNAGAFQSTLGYYHPTLRAVISYDARKAQYAGQRQSPRESNPRRLLADLEALARDHGTAAHELIHLLVTEARFEPEPNAFPHWLHEGLAAQFEVIRGGRWAGIARAHDIRLPDFRAAAAGSPLDLAGLIADGGFGHGYRRDLYARSWALVYFLRKAHPTEFVTFLDHLRVPGSDGSDVPLDHHTAVFKHAFGPDLIRIEAEWRQFLAPIHTPLEGHTPPPLSR